MVKVAQAIAAPFNHFDLIVQPLDKAAGVAVMKIVRYFLQPLLQCAEEGGVSPNRRFFRHSKLSCLDALDSLICVHSTLT